MDLFFLFWDLEIVYKHLAVPNKKINVQVCGKLIRVDAGSKSKLRSSIQHTKINCNFTESKRTLLANVWRRKAWTNIPLSTWAICVIQQVITYYTISQKKYAISGVMLDPTFIVVVNCFCEGQMTSHFWLQSPIWASGNDAYHSYTLRVPETCPTAELVDATLWNLTLTTVAEVNRVWAKSRIQLRSLKTYRLRFEVVEWMPRSRFGIRTRWSWRRSHGHTMKPVLFASNFLSGSCVHVIYLKAPQKLLGIH